MPVCRLCHEEKPLIGKSHIIPEFMYKYSGLYDEKHRLRSFSIDDLLDGKPPSLKQSGVHEGGILCSDCDNRRLGQQLENYAKKAIYGGNNLFADECPECTHYINDELQLFAICKNISYVKYKLFLLSILWRAGISKRSFFHQVQLGDHEEILREMILKNDPKNFNDYPIFIVTTAGDKQFSSDMIIEPRQITAKDGMETCYFIIGGFIYIFKLGSFTERLAELKSQTINEENSVMMLQTKPGSTLDLIKNYMGL